MDTVAAELVNSARHDQTLSQEIRQFAWDVIERANSLVYDQQLSDDWDAAVVASAAALLVAGDYGVAVVEWAQVNGVAG